MKVTTAEIVAMRQAAAQPDAGAALLERRAALDAELDQLGAAGHAAAEAMQRLAELDGEELALTQATRIAWEAWAHNPDTSPPSSGATERQDIDRRRALRTADFSTATKIEKVIAPRRAELEAELRQVNDEIFARKINEVLAEGVEINKEIHRAAAEMIEASTRVNSLGDALRDLTSEAVRQGNDHRVAALRSALSKLEALKQPSLSGLLVRRQALAAIWKTALQ